MKYEVVIGLEVHAELSTKTKAFCACENRFGAEVNTLVCPICAAMPGTLPLLNEEVVVSAVKMGKATGCSINLVSSHDRKNYFYPDLTKAYQITQQVVPICENGEVRFLVDGESRTVRLRRIHIEEDTAKLLHESGFAGTLIDLNRCGVPLIEIVTQPDLRTPDEAHAFLETVRSILVELGISSGKMQEGCIRCDVNVSVRPEGQQELGTRIEMKNISTFSGARKAITFESNRQIAILEGGGILSQETRRWDEGLGESILMRTKEDAMDYRYFPEPDLPPVVITQAFADAVTTPELAHQRMLRYCGMGLPAFDAGLLAETPERSVYFEKCLQSGLPVKSIANWICGDFIRLLAENDQSFADTTVSPERLTALVAVVESKEISVTAGKTVLEQLFASNETPAGIVERLGLAQVSDSAALESVVDGVLAANAQSVEAYRGGKTNALGFLVGQCMKASGGKANPGVLTKLLKQRLDS